MQNIIRVHPKQLERMLKDDFWKKMYEANPEKFVVTDEPPQEEPSDDNGNGS